jgi:FkbM family methyltransferase
MLFPESMVRLPRRLRRLANLLRRLPLVSVILGDRPLEPVVEQLYSGWVSSNDVVVEVGARMGDATRTFAALAGHVYAFEPAKSSFRVLKTLTRTLHNVEVYNIALSDEHGEADLFSDRSFSGVASLKKLADVDYVSSERVSVTTLDEVSFKLQPTLLALDCEGSELQVLRGGPELLRRLRSVLVETHILSDGSSTLISVQEELGKFFPTVRVERVGNEDWIVARR